ncbi:competence/damage-inducible protein A [Desertibacillus haloalkaliphilus]|uniref:competence/damage-inducible protein A n=1 Tax=Desertibacillus haloalkaliphilus TaxID=1328930 RepID=UPI001C262844|nr:competence/damage-inducible protein A [Desertibacillus haloalkaliphilus]MBU8907365.1 competence/damage-inducible protein A [Desertibacillus haloalkaliphilus]
MNAEIIAVGSELLLGQIANTNAQYISRELAAIGIDVYYHTVVGDNQVRLTNAIEQAQKRADIIIFTGGLGPTKDDLTKATVAAVVGRSIEIDTESLRRIEAYFARHNRAMTPNNKKQAEVIAGSTVFLNNHGMAPGMAFKEEQVTYLLLPGPPKELKPMFRTDARQFLFNQTNDSAQIFSRVLRYFGIGESQLETELEDLIDEQTNPTLAPLAGDQDVTLRLTVKHNNKEDAMKLLDDLEQKIQSRVGDYFYGYGETTIVEQVSAQLSQNSLTIAAAESLTGGLFSQKLTDVPGSSRLFTGSVVCYTNDVKQQVLHIPETMIDEVGVVSAECAQLLARNVANLTHASIGISFTGVAGPEKQEGKEVGTVYVGICTGDTAKDFTLHLSGNREQIRKRSVMYGCFYLLKELKKVEK